MRKTRHKRPPEFWVEVQKLTLMDNIFMNVALEGNIPCVEEMLRVILGKDDLIVKSVHTQKTLQGFGRSVCLDVYAEDSKGVRYNIEIQNADDGADFKRARFHGAMIDAHSLKAGQDFSELPECYVIFITRNDVIGLGKSIYTVNKYIDVDGIMEPFNDGSHIVYVNCSAENDGSDVWKLVHDLQCRNAEDMYLPRLAERVGYLKGEGEGGEIMSNYFEELIERAEKKQTERFARSLLEVGKLTIEEIAKCSGLTLERVQKLATKMQRA